jgi:hypothetical protein
MQLGRILKTALVVGVVVNLYDFLINGVLLMRLMEPLPFMRETPPIGWLVAGDFVAALVFVWVFDRVRGSFGSGAAGGATFGLYAGILVNFPTWIFMYLLVEGMTYSAAWVWTVVGILWGVAAGGAAGWAYDRTGPAGA